MFGFMVYVYVGTVVWVSALIRICGFCGLFGLAWFGWGVLCVFAFGEAFGLELL